MGLPQTLTDGEIQEKLSKMKIPFMETLSRHELLSLYDEYILPKPQRKIFCKNPEKSVKTQSSPEKFAKQSNSVSPVKDSEVNRKRLPDSPSKEGELTRKKFKKITFP